MSQYLGLGDGRDGEMNISSNTTDVLIASALTATGGTDTGTITAGLDIDPGDIVLLMDVQGAGAGSWELATVESYVTTTITFVENITNTYSSKSQLIKVKQLTDLIIQAGFTLTLQGWNGTIGGVFPYMVNGTALIAGTLNGAGNNGSSSTGGVGVGFSGGDGAIGSGTAQSGESSTGDHVASTNQNGSGGGGGASSGAGDNGGSGAGAGHATTGENGGNKGGGGTGGQGGASQGAADLVTVFLGAGGGGGRADGLGGGGGAGGGWILLFCNNFIVPIGGVITVAGGVGGNVNIAGGGGAGGSLMAKAVTVTIVGTVTAAGGLGGISSFGADGGDGRDGRIRIEACEITGTSTPTASESEGGFDRCSAAGFVNF